MTVSNFQKLINRACEAAGVGVTSVYRRKKENAGFRSKWLAALSIAYQQLELVLLERAFKQTIATGRETKPWAWADTWPVARIEVKRLNARAIVLAGSSGQALAFGPGHVELTADAGEWGTYAWNEHVLGAPGYRIAGGSDEIQRNIIGERVLGLPPEPRVDNDVPRDESTRRTV